MQQHALQTMKEPSGSGFRGSNVVNGSMSELIRARNALRQALEKSRELDDELAERTPRLHRFAERLPSLEAAFAPMRKQRKIFDGLIVRIDESASPARDVFSVFEELQRLEQSLHHKDPQHDTVAYVGWISRVEEASSFLSANCNTAIQWLQEMLAFLQENQVLQGQMQRLASHLEALKKWQDSRDGVSVSTALDKLEAEVQRILSLHVFSASANMASRKGDAGKRVPFETLKRLHLIIQKLVDCGRRQRCLDLYTEAREKAVKEGLKALQLEYSVLCRKARGVKLEWRSLEMYIGPWTQHIEVIVKHILEPEYHLCSQVLENLGFEAWEQCFSKIAMAAELMEALQFGEAAAKSRDEPQKLFKLLDMFEAMNNLRASFGKLFSGPGCREVQQKTRDLLKQIVQGAYGIFSELKQQVEKQRVIHPPLDGSLPRVSTFVLGYVKHLAGEFYGPIISQVLAIHHSWTEEAAEGKKPEEGLFSKAVLSIMKILVENLHEWAKSFDEQKEPALFHLFLCHNYWYLALNCKAAELRPLVGEAWIREKQQQGDQHASLYIKSSWVKAIEHLSLPGAITLTGSRVAARELVKARLKMFNSAFEELYQKHSKWAIPEGEMKRVLYGKVVKSIMPAYRTFLQSYGPLIEQDSSSRNHKYVKYSAQSLERLLGNMFQGKPETISAVFDKTINGSTHVASPAPVSVI